MAKMSKGTLRRKTRALGRNAKTLTVKKLTATVKEGDRVVIKINARYPGSPHPRYGGKSGIVQRMQGGAAVVAIMDGRKRKDLIVVPVHLKME